MASMDIPVLEIVACRGFFGTLFTLAAALITRAPNITCHPENRVLVAGRSLSGSFAMICNYFATHLIALHEISTL